MNEKMVISRRETSQDVYKTNDMFGKITNEIEDQRFYKTHFFSSNADGLSQPSPTLKEYLYNIFDVSNIDSLIDIFKGEWELVIASGISDPEILVERKQLKIYYDDFELFYDDRKTVTNSSKTVKDLYNDSRRPSTLQIAKIVEKISKRAPELEFTAKEKMSLTQSIPIILKENNIRLQRDDVFDINKVAIREVIEIGRMILSANRKAAAILEVNDVKKEHAWQKYFEKYGTYLLFGSIKLDPQHCLDKEKTKEFNDKYPDILTLNRYGFIDIIELKRSDVELFKFDDSHKKLVPTPYLSGALSQLNGYLQTIPYAFSVEEAKKQSLECASGMLIIGSSDNLLKGSADLNKWVEKNRLSSDDLKFLVRQELRKLNYSYSHMQVVLYDELIDTLENFINNMC